MSAAWLSLVMLAVLSCNGSVEQASDGSKIGTLAQPLIDVDADGMDDGWENQHFGNLSQVGTGDVDADGLTNGEEYSYGFDPTTADALDDADGDRFPNIFEVRNGGDPNNASSTPTPLLVVNGAGGGTHTTVSAAASAATSQSGSYVIIGIAPGVYSGSGNINIYASSPTKKVLLIGLQGAAKTIFEGGASPGPWYLTNTAVVSSLTFRKGATLQASSSTSEFRFVDLVFTDNTSVSYAGAINVSSAAKTVIAGSTFLNNTGNTSTYANQVYFGSGTATLINTVIWGQSAGAMLAKSSGVALTTSYSLVKGQTLTGVGNLAGTTDPKLRSDGRVFWDSPLRSAGGASAQSRTDIDLEVRPLASPDIGADQFNDADADELADSWELQRAGDLGTLTSRSQDADGDGLSNDQEYAVDTKPTVADTDGDGLSDGDELTVQGTNPLSTDTDGDDMPDAWEVAHSLAPSTANGFDDADGDRFPNVYEYAYGTDPSDRTSTPTPTLVVNGAGGGTHTTVSAAATAASSQSGSYVIIGIAPGVYSGSGNINISASSSTKKLLLIGLQGAAKTIFEGGATAGPWYLSNTAVVSSLTFRKGATLQASSSTGEFRFVDLVFTDNTSVSYAGAITVSSAAKTVIAGSTFLNNTGNTSTYANQVYFGSGTATLINTVIWGQSAGAMLAKSSGVALTTSYSLVKGQTLAGVGNLAGTTDPKLRSDGRVFWDSPLRSAGGASAQSRTDIDLELRPLASPDIGADQFNDADADELADSWELQRAGDLGTLTSRSQDADGDGLSNDQEYAVDTKPTVADTDGDGLSDGEEVTVRGTNPLSTDTDGDDMPDAWEVAHGLAPSTANGFDDADGDRFPNVYEYAYGTDPSDRASTPTPTLVVNGAGGGTHTTVSAAATAASSQSGSYVIIGIAPGVYSGSGNINIYASSPTKKVLLIGLQGAAKTIFEGGASPGPWYLTNTAVVSSLTFRKGATLQASSSSSEFRFVDLVFTDNTSVSYAGAITVSSAAKTVIAGSTFLNNTGNTSTYANQVYFGSGTATLINTVIWGQSAGAMLAKSSGVGLTTSYSLVKGQTLAGVGNLAGTTDPKLRSDGRVFWDSPLRSAGGASAQSRTDIDLEVRPLASPDIGADQFNDADADELADSWELQRAGDLGTLTSRSQDADGDGLSNDQEYAVDTKPTVADTDGDGLSDGDELTVHGTNPLSTDTDGDDMPDAWEVAHSLAPSTANGFDDADGDRFPNVYEYAYGTDPSDRASTPTPLLVVNGAGGGTHTTVSAAASAASSQSGSYVIIGIAPGVYTGGGNVNITASSSTKKVLLIGLQGAAKTIFDGGTSPGPWYLTNTAVVSSLTFRKGATLQASSPTSEFRFVDLVIKDNTSVSYAAAVHVSGAAKTVIAGSTFMNNTGNTTAYANQVYFGSGTATLINTVIGGQSAGAMLAKASGVVLTTSYSLVKGETLAGVGNLTGTTDPKLRSDLRLRSDSPLRGAGGAQQSSLLDEDLELRVPGAIDIGADQWKDSDADELPDAWEYSNYGSLDAIAGLDDEDNDGLSNAGEYDWETDLLDTDTDDDGAEDGYEVASGTNPVVRDADDLTGDLNRDRLIDSIGIQLGYHPTTLDDDGDSISNEDEVRMCLDPLRSDSDGDGVADNLDAFPFDPIRTALSFDPADVTPPVITLVAPWNAVEL